MNSRDTLWEFFQTIPGEYRSAPFWAWNDRLDPEEIGRQAGDMGSHGFGGFFMHSRDGLETEYMGSDWMSCVHRAVDTAKERGMAAWLYDEDRWPSGAAGGRVPRRGGDEFRAKSITIEILRGEESWTKQCGPFSDDTVLFRAQLYGSRLTEYHRADNRHEELNEPDGAVLIFRKEVSGPCEWFNDDAPADNLSPNGVRAFIEETYEVYKREVGAEFGKTVKGIFTDEPNIADGNCVYPVNRGWIPWTDGFEDYFRQKRGYDLTDSLPLLFFTGSGCERVRHDYWRTIMERFCEAYSRQIGSWCEENGLLFTGHYLVENELGSSTRMGGAIMPHYRYQHIPGIDLLREQNDEILTVKQCVSVARQFGRKRVLSESYACIGWDLDFESQKWVYDWQYALGVNLRCPHLSLYSLRGCRKRDYPPSFNYNTSWWKYNGLMEDYFGRIGAVMSQGDAVREVLVIHPVSTAWTMLGADPVKTGGWFDESGIREVNEFGDQFNRFLKELLAFHYDFELGDETIMQESGRVGEGRLAVGLAQYRLVIIPPVTTLFASTVRLLEDFMMCGGHIIAMEPLPYMVEGVEDAAVTRLFQYEAMHIAGRTEEALQLLERLLPRRVGLTGRDGKQQPELLSMLRELPGVRTLFVVNTDRQSGCSVRIALDAPGRVEEWDLLTGRASELNTHSHGAGISFPAQFGPADSKLFVITDGAPGMAASPQEQGTLRRMGVAGPEFRFCRTMPNVLTLDKCRWRMNVDGTEDFSEEMEIWMAQREIRGCLGMRQVYLNGLPQRYKWIGERHPKDGIPLELELRFQVREIPQSVCWLVAEDAAKFQITLNGVPITGGPEGWFLDRSFQKIRLPDLRAGENRLLLQMRYENRMELEDFYLLGDFGVGATREITAEPELLMTGDWCGQGYPHYCGAMIYSGGFACGSLGMGDRVLMKFGAYSAVTMEVRVNGETAGMIPWRAAKELDITGFVHEGYNSVEIEVMGSPRNMLGPLHDSTGNTNISCESFRTEGAAYTADYRLSTYGLFEPIGFYRTNGDTQNMRTGRGI